MGDNIEFLNKPGLQTRKSESHKDCDCFFPRPDKGRLKPKSWSLFLHNYTSCFKKKFLPPRRKKSCSLEHLFLFPITHFLHCRLTVAASVTITSVFQQTLHFACSFPNLFCFLALCHLAYYNVYILNFLYSHISSSRQPSAVMAIFHFLNKHLRLFTLLLSTLSSIFSFLHSLFLSILISALISLHFSSFLTHHIYWFSSLSLFSSQSLPLVLFVFAMYFPMEKFIFNTNFFHEPY